MIEIKRNNETFFTLEDICDGSKLSRQLMDHHYIVLKFSTAEPVYFEIGDSVEIADFGSFELTSAYFPKFNESNGGYDYELQMDAYYIGWKNKICKYRPKYGANETSFKITSSVSVHLSVVLSNLKALNYKYNNQDFSVNYTTYNNNVFDVEKHFLVEYNSVSIYEALNAICEALDCEWWVDGSVIYLGYCEMKGQTTFEQGVNMLSMSQSESKSSYITRLYAFGSDKNIPHGYFTGTEADITTDGVATDYLMLPDKEADSDGYYSKDGYMENTNVVKNDKQAIEGVVFFDDEYPKVDCIISGIKTYQSTAENEDGTKVTQTFWQVTSQDSFATKFEKSWIKRNLTLMIKFTSGALIGMEFEVSYKIINNTNYFEIVANDNYGRTLPDTVLCPKLKDKFYLYNWDATKLTETNLISEARETLFARAKNYYKKSMIDNSNFNCVMDGEKFYNNGTYNYHSLGEQVKLVNPMFADIDKDGKHYRNSRIIGMEINLDIPYDSPTYIVGEKASYSRLGQMETNIDSITANGKQIGVGNSGGGVYVIGMNDTTPETDSNVYSARKTRMSFLSRIFPDTAQSLIKFLKGIAVGDGTHGIDGNGVAILKEILSKEFDDAVAEGALGEGFFLGQRKDSDGNGYSYLEVDRMLVRKVAEFVKLVVTELRSVGGTIVLSPASMVCTKVEQRLNNGALVSPGEGSMPDFYRCYFRSEEDGREINNEFEVGDMARCQTFNIKTGTTANAKNRYYWRKVVAVGADYIDLSPTDCDRSVANDIPAQGDEIVAMGNASDTSRQAVITLSAYGANAPSIVLYRGVNSYSLSGKEVMVLSKKEVYILADRLYYRAADGTAKSVSEALKQAAEGMTDISKRMSTLEVTSDSIAARVTKTEKTVKAQGDELAEMGTKIEQTAEGISLAVSRQTSRRENILTGSALRRDDSYMARLVGDTQIRCNGYGGTNFLRLTDTYDGTTRHYYGMQWGNTTNTAYAPNVAVKKGRHTVAVMARSAVKGKGILKVEAFLHAERWDAVRLASDATAVRRWSGTFALDAADTWEMKTLDVDVTEEGRFMEVYVFLYCAEQGVTYTLDVCRPMLCEADFYVWSQSVADYAYTGGNMLAGSRALSASNLTVKGAIAAGGYGSAASVTNAYSGAQTDTLTWSGIRLEANTDYTLSFMAKGNGTMACYLHNGSAASVKYAENSQGLTVGAGWGAVTVKPSTEWQRYWVHFRTADTTTLDFYCIIGRLTATDALVTIAEPKLEKGATATEWTDLAADLIEEGSVETRLLESGIDIRNRKITAHADTFEIRNNAGTLTASVNKDGVLETTDAVLGGTLRAKDGYFSGFVKKSLCPVTPDSIGTLGTIDTSTGYVTLDFTKTGSMMVLMGDLKSKIGQHNELTLMLKYGTTGGSSAEAFFYLDQKIVILNNSNVTVGIPAAAAGTVTPSGTPTIDGGYMMVLEPVVNITVNSGISTATYAMRWNVKRAKM